MTDALLESAWPAARLGDALVLLARRLGLEPGGEGSPELTPPPSREDGLDAWMEQVAASLGLDLDHVEARHDGLERALGEAAPALLRMGSAEGERFHLLLGCRGRTASLLGQDGTVHRVSLERLAVELRGPSEAQPGLEALLETAAVTAPLRERARAALLGASLGAREVAGLWSLRLAPETRFRQQLQNAGAGRWLLAFVLAQLAHEGLFVLSWWVLGGGAFAGHLERGWVLGWALLLLTSIPFRLLALWAQARLSVEAGRLLRQRLLAGALRLDPDEIRHQGIGQLLGRVMESESLETLSLAGGFVGVLALVELGMAVAVLRAGAGGGWHALLLVGWIAATCGLIGVSLRQRERWTDARMELTHDLVEQMVGQRTRVAQQAPARWHSHEDAALERHLGVARRMDAVETVLRAVGPRGWLVVALLGLAPGFVWGEVDLSALAISLGGILLGLRGLTNLTDSLSALLGAGLAWKQVSQIFHSAARPLAHGKPLTIAPAPGAAPAVLEAHNLTYQHRGRSAAILQGCNLQVHAQERVLLQGASGSGKSTLASVLAGLRQPASGVVLLGGLDRQTVGGLKWRRNVVLVPQFHENHLFTGTLAFNLLMGHRWPPRDEDYEAARDLCRQLGLGRLLEAMPAGILQIVGESGWQLSHGERSRVFMARALLQGAQLLVLDESLGALDPLSLQQCLDTVLKRAPTLLVIAHP
ncbi:MAG: ATP-binding cassette domain-containing protein [Hyalangium sp.]|uniref:ATP-binding cassette domain-containing protein n=1 Tax=Hyalangium sp. TaxID=2028555 RepID=UPI00389AB837